MPVFRFVKQPEPDLVAQECQICSKIFTSTSALRSHITDYQLREQDVLLRLLELQWHAPTRLIQTIGRRTGYDCQVCFENVASKDMLQDHIQWFQHERQRLVESLSRIIAHDDSDEDHDRLRGNGTNFSIKARGTQHYDAGITGRHMEGYLVKTRARNDGILGHTDIIENAIEHAISLPKPRLPWACPNQECKKKDRRFLRRLDLSSHFISHSRCLQLCVRCLEVSTKVSIALRHNCSGRGERVNRESAGRRIEALATDQKLQLRLHYDRLLAAALSVRQETGKRREQSTVLSDREHASHKRFKSTASQAVNTPSSRHWSKEAPLVDRRVAQSECATSFADVGGVHLLPSAALSAEGAATVEDGSYQPPASLATTTSHDQLVSRDGAVPIPTLTLSFRDGNISPPISTTLPFTFPPVFDIGNVPPLMPLAATLSDYAPIFNDGNVPPLMPLAATLSDYAPIFSDSNVPPLMPLAATLSDYAPIFNDGNVPSFIPLAATLDDYALIFNDGNIPPTAPSREPKSCNAEISNNGNVPQSTASAVLASNYAPLFNDSTGLRS